MEFGYNVDHGVGSGDYNKKFWNQEKTQEAVSNNKSNGYVIVGPWQIAVI